MVSEPNTRQYASKEAQPRRGVDTNRCASKDVGSRRVVDWGSHIDWRGERVPAKDARPRKEMDCEIPHQLERGTKHSL